MDNRADPVGFDNGPDEIGYSREGDEERFHGEQVADLMNREPDGRQAAQPKQEETEEVSGVGA